MNEYYPHIFEPLSVGGVTFKNRVFTAPTMAHMVQNNAPTYPEPPFIAHYLQRAKGGAAQVNCGGQQVNDPGRNSIHSKFDIEDATGWRNFIHLTEAIHCYDAKCSYELLHFGSEGEYTAEARRERIYGCSDFVRGDGLHFHEMPYEEMDKLAERYADLAECVAFCGFDTLLIHGGHGTLLQEFLSPRSNRRTDEFGGSMDNRARFPLMVLDRIRARVGRDLLIEYRISGSERVPGGFEVEDCIEFLKLAQDRIDIAHISAGVVREPRLRAVTHPTGFLPEAANAYLAKAVKACPDVRIPVLTVGAFQRPEAIERVLAAGEADIVAMARGFIADPDVVHKMSQGRPDDIVPCIKCFHCLDEFKTTHLYSCAVNPAAGRETRLAMLTPARYERLRVAVVGGGPAGMEASLVAAERGHDVVLFERAGRLGGRLNEADAVPFKYDLSAYRDYLERRVAAQERVEVRLGCEATPELLAGEGFDAVFAAVGAEDVVPPVPGANGPGVVLASEAAAEPGRLGECVVVVGGGQVGCETAVHLAMCGKQVTLLEMGPALAPDAMRTYREELLGQVQDRCQSAVDARVVEIAAGQADAGDAALAVGYVVGEGERRTLPADAVVLACGLSPRSAAAEAFRACAPTFRAFGDCSKVGNVKTAVRGAFEAALTLGRIPGEAWEA